MSYFGLFPAGIFAVKTMLMLIILLSFTNGMEIQVISGMNRHEKLLTIEVQKTDTVATLKANITEKLKEIFKNKDGIPPEEFSLRYYKKGNGLILEDSKRLEEYGIKDDAETIFLLELIEFKIFIEHKGARHSFNVLADDFVKSVKEKIKEKLGIPPEDQILRRPDGHVIWEEYSQMRYHNIVRGTCLSLKETFEFSIFIEHKGTTHSFRVNADESVKSLKEKIEMRSKIPPEDQILTRPDGHVLWEESTKMKDHNIVRGTCLSLNIIKVQYDGNSYNIEVDKATETVKDLKKKTIKKINECIPKDENNQIKKLTLKDQQGKILEDDKKTIADYKIQGPLTVVNAEIKERKRVRIAKALHIHNSRPPAQKRK